MPRAQAQQVQPFRPCWVKCDLGRDGTYAGVAAGRQVLEAAPATRPHPVPALCLQRLPPGAPAQLPRCLSRGCGEVLRASACKEGKHLQFIAP